MSDKNNDETGLTLSAFKLITKFGADSYTHNFVGESPSDPERMETWVRIEVAGSGAFGTVWKEECMEGGALRAVKQILKSRVAKRELISMAMMFPHSGHFVKFIGWFEDHNHLYLAMEYLHFGDLWELIQGPDAISEVDIKTITTQVLRGLDLMHQHKICHRDIKPQVSIDRYFIVDRSARGAYEIKNILIASRDPLVVKIADFGISKHVDDQSELRTCAGTPAFCAPEIWNLLDTQNHSYTTLVDMWSLGCVVYTMFTKRPPFSDSPGLYQYFQGKRPLPLYHPRLRTANRNLPHFLSRLLVVQPDIRLTAEKAPQHPWVTGDESTSSFQILRGALTSSPEGNSASQLDPTPPRLKRADALLAAVDSDQLEIVRLMLERGADVLGKRKDGETALHRAALRGHVDVVELLLTHGVDIHSARENGATALTNGCRRGHLGVVQLLISRGAWMNQPLENGSTPLYLAANKGHLLVVQYLLDHGACIATARDTGATPLDIAAQLGHAEVVQCLISRGADVSQKCKNSSTALHRAALRGHVDVVELLLTHGADIHSVRENGATALTNGCSRGHLAVVQRLIAGGARMEQPLNDGSTPLFLAAQKGHLPVVRYLLNGGASIAMASHHRGDSNAQTNNRESVLSVAVRNSHLDVVATLQDWVSRPDPMTLGSSYFNMSPQSVTSAVCGSHSLTDTIEHPLASVPPATPEATVITETSSESLSPVVSIANSQSPSISLAPSRLASQPSGEVSVNSLPMTINSLKSRTLSILHAALPPSILVPMSPEDSVVTARKSVNHHAPWRPPKRAEVAVPILTLSVAVSEVMLSTASSILLSQTPSIISPDDLQAPSDPTASTEPARADIVVSGPEWRKWINGFFY